MPNSPEAEHLQRAVDAVREALLPERRKQPIPERKEEDAEREEIQEEGER